MAILYQSSNVVTPQACVRGKAIGLFVVVIGSGMKITSLGDLGI